MPRRPCTDSGRVRETSKSALWMGSNERLALAVIPQRFFAARGSTYLSPNIISRDYTSDHHSWCLTTDGWVGKRCSQELWTDLDVAVRLSVVNWGGEAMRVDRLRRPAAQASRHLRLVHQRLLYSSHSPYALYSLLCNTNTGARTLGVTLLSPTSLAAVFASLCPTHSFFADMCTDPSFFTISECTAPLQTAVAHACARCTLAPAEIRHRFLSSNVNCISIPKLE